MLDHTDRTLHLPARGEGKHLRTACGLQMVGRTTVGPIEKLIDEAARYCPECWLGRPHG